MAAIASGVAVLVILAMVFSLRGIAPFGDASMSLAVVDAQYQYLDFFSYLRRVLLGEDSLVWTFSKGLGGTPIVVFSYYLASPLNLLFLAFPEAAGPAVYDVVVMLKLSLAAVTASIFLSGRFPRMSRAMGCCLAVSYGLMQYSIAQAGNVMWLDGVYMLPLMLLGVHRVASGSSLAPLAAAAGCSILFNWYTGGINCLFAIDWLFLEIVLALASGERRPVPTAAGGGVGRWVLRCGGRFAAAMPLAIGASLVLFLPTLLELSGGRASGGWMGPNPLVMFGNPLSSVAQGVIGSQSTQESVSLFCGSLAALGCLSCLLCRRVSWRVRATLLALLALCSLMLYWKPLVAAFSLFKSATSYWSRYSYCAILAIVFVAGWYFDETSEGDAGRRSRYLEALPAGLALAALYAALGAAGALERSTWLAATCASFVLQGVALFLAGAPARVVRGAATAAGSCLLAGELALNAWALAGSYSNENAESRAGYVTAQRAQIDSLSAYDGSLYRVGQTSTWGSRPNELTANYNEGLAFGYPSIQTYTSDPVDSQRVLLDSLGYTICGENMNIVNGPVLGADSLLGVRYVLSADEIPGMEPIEGVAEGPDGKAAWENPYALPLAFVWPGEEDAVALEEVDGGGEAAEGNPFEYQSRLWSQLLGREVELYEPVECKLGESVAADGTRVVRVEPTGLSEGDVVYANALLADQGSASVLHMGETDLAYSQWGAPSVVSVPCDAADGFAFSIELSGDNDLRELQLYRVDLDALEAASAELSGRAADMTYLGDGSFDLAVDSPGGGALLLTVPLRDGWEVTVNGRDVEPTEAFGCLVSVPLEDGANVVEMRYVVPGLVPGAMASVASVAGIVAVGVADVRRRRRVEGPSSR